jgi:tetratricopeptide (TPR) repeat protein
MQMAQQKQQSAHAQIAAMPPEMQAMLKNRQPGNASQAQQLKAYAAGMAQTRMQAQGAAGGPEAGGAAFAFKVMNAVPKENPSVHLAGKLPASQSRYLELVNQVLTECSTTIGQEACSRIDEILASGRTATRCGGASLGALLMVAPCGTPAPSAYACARAALADPMSALAANNLGMALQLGHFYDRSYEVLLYADSRCRNSPSIISNMGYAAMYLGDFQTAQMHFNLVANKLDPSIHEVLLGPWTDRPSSR